MFNRVTYNEGLGRVPARVNRATGELQLNPAIWNGLSRDYRNFILYHEQGHLVLQTASEAEANRYAVQKFAPIASLPDAEGARRILAMAEITSEQRTKAFGANQYTPDKADWQNFDIVTSMLGFAKSIDAKFSAIAADSQQQRQLFISTTAAQNTTAKNQQAIIILVILAILSAAALVTYKILR